MSYIYSLRSVAEDRDLSRAAAERYLLLQALSQRQGRGADLSARPDPDPAAPQRAYVPTGAPRPVVAPEPAVASMVE